jgi:uncharacterized protein
MQIPTNALCNEMIQDMGMLDHIIDHSRQVCRVALFLCEHLVECAVPLNWELIFAGALLHDITKTRSFTTGENHAQTGGMYLTERGYREVGEVVRQHVCLDRYADPLVIDEAAVVNYADKRVLNDQIVSLEVRMHYIFERYGKSLDRQDRIDWLWKMSTDLETAIFCRLSFTPAGLSDAMDIRHSPAYGIRFSSEK